jgi:hypothetical protein
MVSPPSVELKGSFSKERVPEDKWDFIFKGDHHTI